MTADEIIARLGLNPHPEGGHYAETFRDERLADGRPASTAIYYLLKRGERSHWHRIDAAEIWHFYAGAALVLSVADKCGARDIALGASIVKGEVPQGVVPAGAWQAARSTGEWSLAGCTVAPGFDFAQFELAPPDFDPR